MIFEEPRVEIVTDYQNKEKQTVIQFLPCYHITKEEDPTKDNPCDINILEIEGEREVKGPNIGSEDYAAPLKIKKVNIGTT
jgi:hypothetical protein